MEGWWAGAGERHVLCDSLWGAAASLGRGQRNREERAKESRGVGDTFAVFQHSRASLEGKKNDSSATEE